MLLALDVGNTNIMIGAYEGAELRAHWRVRTVRDRTADEHGVLLRSLFAAADLPLSAVKGGAIAPGIGISLDALFQAAARLQRVELVRPPCVIGQTTSESIQSGVIFGFVGQVEGIVARLRKVLGGHARVVGTGGLAELIAAE